MTCTSVRNRHEFSCDSCPRGKVVVAEEFAEAWGSLREQGWTAFKHEQHWHHECLTCSREEA